MLCWLVQKGIVTECFCHYQETFHSCMCISGECFMHKWLTRWEKDERKINKGLSLTRAGHGCSIIFCSEKARITGARGRSPPDGEAVRWALSAGNICRMGLVVSNLASLEEKQEGGMLGACNLIIICYLIYSASRLGAGEHIFKREQMMSSLAPREKLTIQQALDC